MLKYTGVVLGAALLPDPLSTFSDPNSSGTPGSAEEDAKLVLFLASDASGHMSGTEVWIDGAQSQG